MPLFRNPTIATAKKNLRSIRKELPTEYQAIQKALADEQTILQYVDKILSILENLKAIIKEAKTFPEDKKVNALQASRSLYAKLLQSSTYILIHIEEKLKEEVQIIRTELGVSRQQAKEFDRVFNDLKRRFSHGKGPVFLDHLITNEARANSKFMYAQGILKTEKQLTKDLRKLLIHAKRTARINRVKRELRNIWNKLSPYGLEKQTQASIQQLVNDLEAFKRAESLVSQETSLVAREIKDIYDRINLKDPNLKRARTIKKIEFDFIKYLPFYGKQDFEKSSWMNKEYWVEQITGMKVGGILIDRQQESETGIDQFSKDLMKAYEKLIEISGRMIHDFRIKLNEEEETYMEYQFEIDYGDVEYDYQRITLSSYKNVIEYMKKIDNFFVSMQNMVKKKIKELPRLLDQEIEKINKQAPSHKDYYVQREKKQYKEIESNFMKYLELSKTVRNNYEKVRHMLEIAQELLSSLSY